MLPIERVKCKSRQALKAGAGTGVRSAQGEEEAEAARAEEQQPSKPLEAIQHALYYRISP
jgi:hypothetical protein